MKRLCAALALLCLLAGCGSAGASSVAMEATTTQTMAQTTEQTTIAVTMEQALLLYQEFLAGERSAKTRNENTRYGEEVCIDDIFLGDGGDRYAFFDVNGDGIPELHVHRMDYTILTCEDGELLAWGDFHHMSKLLNNGDILLKRLPGAGYNVSYDYIELDLNGNEQSRIGFARSMPHMINDELIFDENSHYWFEGKEVSMEEWDTLTEKYLSVGSVEIEWIDIAPSAQ